MRAALLCCQWETEAGMIFGVPAEQQQCATCFFPLSYKWSEHGAVSPWAGMLNPEWIQSGVITERLERREERALIHSRLWSHPPQQTEYTSSFLHLRPIQAKIKTSITLFEKCKRIYGLKVMKSEFKKAGSLQLTSYRRRTVVCERRGSWCSGRWIFVLLSHHILLVLQFRNFHA